MPPQSVGSVSRSLDSCSGEIVSADVPRSERANVSREHPDLIVGYSPAPRRHSIGSSLINRFEYSAWRTAEMPAAILKARAHGTGAVCSMTIDAVVRDEQLLACRDCLLVSLVWIPELQRRTRRWKSYRKILGMRNHTETVTAIPICLRARIGTAAHRVRPRNDRADADACRSFHSHPTL